MSIRHRHSLVTLAVLATCLSMAGCGQSSEFRKTRKKARAGDAEAQCRLGVMYAKGEGMPRDFTEADRWWRKAAEQGLADAQSNLGRLYNLGAADVPKDYAESIKWYRKAAEQGDVSAAEHLGFMLYEGREGVPPDYAEAFVWLALSSHISFSAATDVLAELELLLTPEDLAAAQRRVRELRPEFRKREAE